MVVNFDVILQFLCATLVVRATIVQQTPLHLTLVASSISNTAGIWQTRLLITAMLLHSTIFPHNLAHSYPNSLYICTVAVASALPPSSSSLSLAWPTLCPPYHPHHRLQFSFFKRNHSTHVCRCLGCLQQLLWQRWTTQDDDFGQWYTYVCMLHHIFLRSTQLINVLSATWARTVVTGFNGSLKT